MNNQIKSASDKADRIAALQAQVERLRETLTIIATADHEDGCQFSFAPFNECPTCKQPHEYARAALNEGSADHAD